MMKADPLCSLLLMIGTAGPCPAHLLVKVTLLVVVKVFIHQVFLSPITEWKFSSQTVDLLVACSDYEAV